MFLRTLKRCLCCLSALMPLGGCATYDPNAHYDPAAVEKTGIITSKTLAMTEPVKTKPKGNFLPVPMHGSVQMIYIPDAGRTSYKDIYEYEVMVSGSETVSVLSAYSSFAVGDCAKVFLSSKPSYPRIAYGGGCPATSSNISTPVISARKLPMQASAQAKRARLQEELRSRAAARGYGESQCDDSGRCATQTTHTAKGMGEQALVNKIPLTIGFADLSAGDVSGVIAEDNRALSGLFAQTVTAPKGQIPRAQVLFVYAKLNGDGTLSGGSSYILHQLIRDSSASLVIVALPNPVQIVKDVAHATELKNTTIIYTLDRNEGGFSRFFQEIFIKMHNGKPLLNAWVELAPQNSHAMPGYVPKTIVMAPRNIKFPQVGDTKQLGQK